MDQFRGWCLDFRGLTFLSVVLHHVADTCSIFETVVSTKIVCDLDHIGVTVLLLAEQIGKLTLERVSENGNVSFKANGQIDFFGEEALTRLSGAGGPDSTTRASRL